MSLDCYFICGTPRTGSTLLCSLLKSSGVAGVPESYFRKQDLKTWAAKWDVPVATNGSFLFSDYMKAAVAAGRTENGVCAVRVMWGTMAELTSNLDESGVHTQDIHVQDIQAQDIDVLGQNFGKTRFIYLKRQDYVAQAVSLLKAEQTDIWHIINDSKSEVPAQDYEYNFERLRALRQEIADDNQAWVQWFEENNIKPCEIFYEELSEKPVDTVLEVLGYLGLALPSDVILKANNKRMADSHSASWIKRFQTEIIISPLNYH
jgi:LPS sulfotransferase NodH